MASGAASAAPATGASASVPSGTAKQSAASWRVDLSATGGEDGANLRYADGALGIRDTGVGLASADGAGGYGSGVLPVHTVERAVNRIAADVRADAPAGARAVVDVRGRDGEHGAWTEWREATPGAPAELPRAVTEVQARLTLSSGKDGAGPAVRSLRLTADRVSKAAPLKQTAEPFTAQVYATREGLVGYTTANGHVIQPNDHFVALPSRRGLSANGSGEYSVRVCGPARCETAPVWDVGPWNTHDDYWNPSANRESFKDLPRGKPEAQAAYQDGYNGGRDEFGRAVLNPAGIDLADGTFYNVGLNDNGWVTVTYLWTGDDGGATKSFPTWGTDVSVRQAATTASTRVGSLAGPTTVRVQCQVHGELVQYQGYTNDAWSYLPDYGGYVSNIFMAVPDAWLPGVPDC